MYMNDDFDFGPPPSSEDVKLQSRVADLLVLIDTLQTQLRTAESVIKQHEPEHSLFTTPSYKWCMNWKPHDQ